MKNLEIEQLYELYSQNSSGVCTDTRNILSGGMFFALKGETFNGNAFALAAIQGGAAYAVVDEPEVEAADQEHSILVEDVLVAVQQMARHTMLKWLSRFRDLLKKAKSSRLLIKSNLQTSKRFKK